VAKTERKRVSKAMKRLKPKPVKAAKAGDVKGGKGIVQNFRA